ncbi:MAG: 50S ribosomal protein L11 methyltransferase [Chloroflexi bacterium]|nr:50S ribosomal protein L11 methyltransferase [Chloroflexota bacterium]
MKWLQLSVSTPQEFVEPLSQIFYRYGHGGVAVEQAGSYNPDEGETLSPDQWVTVTTYLPINDSTNERRNQIDVGVRLVAHVSPIEGLQEREVEEQEWQDAWKVHFDVLHITDRIVIAPSWKEYSPRPHEAVVTLDPGMAFGTGHHPTTKMCLEQLDELVKPGMDVIDVGCGSGILSIAAARLGARHVFGIEIDSVAVNVAKQNIRDNGLEHTIRPVHGSLPHPDVRADAYDVAVANISAKIIIEISGELVRATKSGGKIVASGILAENKDGPIEALTDAGATLESTLVDGDWVTLVCRLT